MGKDYILKRGDREKLMKSLEISKALHHPGFVASLPVPTRAGSEYLEGKEVFVLTRRLRGKPLSRSDMFGYNRVKYGEQYGRSIARLHKALKTAQKDILPDEANLYRKVTEWALPSVRRQNIRWSMGLEDSFFDGFIEGLGYLYDKLPKQLIHRDPHPDNILFDNGAVTGFVDFDLSEINVRLWDVCYCATGILSHGSDKAYEKWLEILGGILGGYDLEEGLIPEEKQAVFCVICSVQMICVGSSPFLSVRTPPATYVTLVQLPATASSRPLSGGMSCARFHSR